MSVLEVGVVVVPDTVEALFAELGDGAAYGIRLVRKGWFGRRSVVAEVSPIGIYRIPRIVGEVIQSAWPATFPGPFVWDGLFELVSPGGETLGSGTSPGGFRLEPGDELNLAVELVGKP